MDHCRNSLLEGDKLGFGLVLEPHERERRQIITELLLVDQRPVSLDGPALLERPHTAQARRGGNPGTAGELDIRDTPVCLQRGENLPIDGIETKFHDT